MKWVEVDCDGKITGVQKRTPPPYPPPLPPAPRYRAEQKPEVGSGMVDSVTKQEIEKFWRRKRMVEEDHFNAAIKAAARLRARILSEDDYRRFEESLRDDDYSNGDADEADYQNDIPVGIKDWWTKSKYAYLNQPSIKSMDNPKRRASTYFPQFYYCFKSVHSPNTIFGIC